MAKNAMDRIADAAEYMARVSGQTANHMGRKVDEAVEHLGAIRKDVERFRGISENLVAAVKDGTLALARMAKVAEKLEPLMKKHFPEPTYCQHGDPGFCMVCHAEALRR